MKGKAFWANIAIALFAALLFIPGIGGYRLFDWDEINFAESAREMILTGNWFDVQINFESFWEKPPLFIWAQALSMKVFGVNEFAARFPNALIGIITLLVLFNIGRKAEDIRFGLVWAGMYCISFLPFFYFKSGIIDPWFNLGIFLGIYFFSRYSDPSATAFRARHAALSALFMGLAILTKGPVALLIFCLTVAVWLIFRRFRFSFRWKDVGIYFLVLALVGGAWFIALAATGHSYVIKDFIDYQIRLFETKDAGHGGFFDHGFRLRADRLCRRRNHGCGLLRKRFAALFDLFVKQLFQNTLDEFLHALPLLSRWKWYSRILQNSGSGTLCSGRGAARWWKPACL